MSYFNDIITHLEERRERAINGLCNCIPLPFPRFKEFLPGLEMGKYLVITASQKIGKTKFCDFVYVYETLFFLIKHPNIKVKILYFCLEETAKKKYIEFQCHLLYRLDHICIAPVDLESISKPVSQDIINLLKSDRYQQYIEKFEEMVTYIDDIKNPTGIQKKCWEYAVNHGQLNYKTITSKNPLGESIQRKVIDPINPYIPDDPELYKIVIVDNASNLTSENGLSKLYTIERFSKYAVDLRNKFNYSIILIQHQAQAQEGIENLKLNRIKPSSDGLADCKLTSRDVDLLVGLYSPFKYGIQTFEKYDITKFRNNIRFLEVLEDRYYGANGNICPLYFNGAASYFEELPRPENTEGLKKFYAEIERNRKIPSLVME